MNEVKQAPADPVTGENAAPAESGAHYLEPGSEVQQMQAELDQLLSRLRRTG